MGLARKHGEYLEVESEVELGPRLPKSKKGGKIQWQEDIGEHVDADQGK